jgi:hypothetical protein
VKKGPQREISPRLRTVSLVADLAANKKGAKVMAAPRGLICPSLKRSEM